MNFTKKDILDQMDREAEDYNFPLYLGDEDYVFHMDGRIHAFCDEKRWAVLIEHLCYNPRGGEIDGVNIRIFAYGNCLLKPAGWDPLSDLKIFSYVPEKHHLYDSYFEEVPNEAVAVKIRDKIIPIENDPELYIKSGVKDYKDSSIHISELIRFLLIDHKDIMMANDSDLEMYIPIDIPRILLLQQWYHPFMFDELLPSEVETFQLIAEVLETKDKSRYAPKNQPNTYWKNWRR